MDVVALSVLVLAVVMSLGVAAYLVSQRYHISAIPILVVLGILFGPVVGIIPYDIAHQVFDYIRVLGLFLILYAEGHNLRWPLLQRHLASISVLDTLGLLVTAVVAALAFSWLFHLPILVGFLFGAIISATDPATLIPLFKTHRIPEGIRTILVTESIFNDPLGIVLTALALAILVPAAPGAAVVLGIAGQVGLYPAAVLYFLYVVAASLALGVGMGVLGYWALRGFSLEPFSELFSLALAFAGFAVGEYLLASGYLTATVIGIVLGNHDLFFGRLGIHEGASSAIATASHFNETLSELSTILIFVFLGAGLSLAMLQTGWLEALVLAAVVLFIARPLACVPLLRVGRLKPREVAFVALEGPRGVVPAALAGLPLSLGLAQNDPTLIAWGQVILTATVVVLLASVLVETLWVGPLVKRLLPEA